MPLLGTFSCRPSVSPEPSAARMPSLIFWLSHPQDTAVGRHNSIFVLEHTSSRVGFSSNMRRKLVGLRRMILVFICIFYATRTTRYFSRVWYVHTRTLYEAKQGCGVVSCTIFSCWGACWSKVLVLIYHMYVREDCYFWFFIEIFHFFSRYLVVGSRHDFFFVFFIKKLKNVSCEYNRLNGWNSTLQAAWYIRRVRIIWFLWTKPTTWSFKNCPGESPTYILHKDKT